MCASHCCLRLVLKTWLLALVIGILQICSFLSLSDGTVRSVRRLAEIEDVAVPYIYSGVQDPPGAPALVELTAVRTCDRCGACSDLGGTLGSWNFSSASECVQKCWSIRHAPSNTLPGVFDSCTHLSFGLHGEGCRLHKSCFQQNPNEQSFAVYRLGGVDGIPGNRRLADTPALMPSGPLSRQLFMTKHEAEEALNRGFVPSPYRVWMYVLTAVLVILTVADGLCTLLTLLELLLLPCMVHNNSSQIDGAWTRLRTRAAIIGPQPALLLGKCDAGMERVLRIKVRIAAMLTFTTLLTQKTLTAWLMTWGVGDGAAAFTDAFTHLTPLLMAVTAILGMSQERLHRVLNVVADSRRNMALLRGMPLSRKFDVALSVGIELRTEFGVENFMSVVPIVACHPYVNVLVLFAYARNLITTFVSEEVRTIQDIMQHHASEMKGSDDSPRWGHKKHLHGTFAQPGSQACFLEEWQLRKLDADLLNLVHSFPQSTFHEIGVDDTMIIALMQDVELKLLNAQARKSEVLHNDRSHGREGFLQQLCADEDREFAQTMLHFVHLEHDFDRVGEVVPQVKIPRRTRGVQNLSVHSPRHTDPLRSIGSNSTGSPLASAAEVNPLLFGQDDLGTSALSQRSLSYPLHSGLPSSSTILSVDQGAPYNV